MSSRVSRSGESLGCVARVCRTWPIPTPHPPAVRVHDFLEGRPYCLLRPALPALGWLPDPAR
eukprot:8067283-Pyramimonas_sp.AAC.1